MKKDNYIFPAIFSYDTDGITITFPDLPGCISCADTDEEALYMAKDALKGHLLVMEDYEEAIPDPTSLKNIKLAENEKAVLIDVCLALYRDAYNSRAIKKTLTIPAWLNEAAEKEHISLSFILQSALKERLGINDK